MKAIIISEFGDPSVLTYTELPEPAIKAGEVLVQVKAISINPVDVKTRGGAGVAGRIKQEMPLILGWDISGIVIRAGAEATSFKPGDEVFGMVNFPGHGKAYAELVAAPASQLSHKPANISHEEAAAATLAPLTVWQAFVDHAKVQPGQKVLIHGGAGGVGHYAVQLAKYLGAYVVATSSAANRDFIMGLGADEHIDYRSVRFEEAVQDVDFVFDTIGGENLLRSLEVVKPGGTLISIPSGVKADYSEQARAKNIHCYFILVQSDGEDMQELADLLAKRILRSHVSAVFPFEQMAAAHRQIETGRTVGKVVVTV